MEEKKLSHPIPAEVLAELEVAMRVFGRDTDHLKVSKLATRTLNKWSDQRQHMGDMLLGAILMISVILKESPFMESTKVALVATLLSRTLEFVKNGEISVEEVPINLN